MKDHELAHWNNLGGSFREGKIVEYSIEKDGDFRWHGNCNCCGEDTPTQDYKTREVWESRREILRYLILCDFCFIRGKLVEMFYSHQRSKKMIEALDIIWKWSRNRYFEKNRSAESKRNYRRICQTLVEMMEEEGAFV